ncbi:MAG: MerR family transcriptional regulator [Bacteriovoracia bacterium]
MMDIGEVSKKSGILPSALRYYEEIGLIRSTARKGLRRQYPKNILDLLALITLAKQVGFQLEELPTLLKPREGAIVINRNALKEKSLEIERRIRRLEAARQGLLHASLCKAPSHMECPKFQRLLAHATKKQVKRQKK